MERQSEFYTLNVGKEEVVPKHKDFMVCATANTIGSGEDTFLYAGTKVLNAAFLNRFALTVKMDYIDKINEIRVITSKTGIDNAIAQKMVEAANDVRDAANPARIGGVSGSSRLSATLSTRDILEWADMVVGAGMRPKEAAEFAFLNRTNDTDAKQIRTFISNRI
jgi:cobaltochelatase CobS